MQICFWTLTESVREESLAAGGEGTVLASCVVHRLSVAELAEKLPSVTPIKFAEIFAEPANSGIENFRS